MFLINPTMDDDSGSWHRPSWGKGGVQYSLVGDHVAVLINPTMDGDSTSWHRPSWG